MSGGSYDYAYGRIESFADCISKTTPQRIAFADLLRRVAKAAHDIEWVDSGDYGHGDEDKAIMECFVTAEREVHGALVATIKSALDYLQRVEP